MALKQFLIRTFLFFICAITARTSFSQNKTITGKISDEKGSPLSGVTVTAKGTTQSSATNDNGTFTLQLPNGVKTLVLSSVGYADQEVDVTGNSAINVSLQTAARLLNEVVVVGYGTQRKTDLTGALTSISTKEFAQQPVTRVDQILQGRAAGVQVTNAGGAPGSDTRVRIRGANSVLGNNDPLYVVDGFVGADFSIINPNDIETIQILKDASSTSIYGSRGANGVVIITTKKGTKGGFKVTYDGQASTSEVTKTWDIMNAYDFATIANTRSAALGTSPIYAQAEVDKFKTNPGTNWQDLVFRRSTGQQHQLSFAGGGERTTYLISANYLDQKGIVENTSYKRYTFRSNINSQLTDNLALRFNITGSRIQNHNTGLQSGTGNPIVGALAWSPTTPAYDADGNITTSDPTGSVATSPVALLYDRINDDNRNVVNAIGGINYKLPVKGLAVDLQYAVNYGNGQGAYFNGMAVSRGNPSAGRSTSEQWTLQSTSSLNYIRTFNEVHSISAVAVFETQKFTDNSFSASGNTLKFPELGYYNLPLAGSYSVGSGFTQWTLLSYLARVNYSYKDKYLLTAAVRRDGSSKFQKGNKYSTFPSIGVGYNLSQEDFIKDLNVLSNLKLRGSWGMTGSQAINPYATLSAYNTWAPVAFSNGGVVSGIQLGNPGNLNLKWETTKQSDVGLEIGLLKGKITLEGDYFVKNTSDLLLNQALPSYTGGGTQTKNVGEIQNKGFEVSLGINLSRSKDFNWTSSFNVSTVKTG